MKPDLEQLLEDFEEAWASGNAPAVSEILMRAETGNEELMLELIAVDQEYRWRRYASSSADEQLRPKDHDDPSGLPVRPRLEDYWQRFGIVKSDDRIATDLLANEYRIRRRYGDNPTREEYLQRFPA